MADFSKAVPFILLHEGGFAQTVAGEYVNMGINTDTLKALGYPGTIDQLKDIVKNLTIAQAEDIYQKTYWTFKAPSIPNALDQVISQTVAGKILDMTVLSGQRTAVKLVQRALGLTEDGYFGQATLDAINQAGDSFVQQLVTVWSASLSTIADEKVAEATTANDQTLIAYWTRVKVGWLRRAAWLGV